MSLLTMISTSPSPSMSATTGVARIVSEAPRLTSHAIFASSPVTRRIVCSEPSLESMTRANMSPLAHRSMAAALRSMFAERSNTRLP